MVCCTRGSHHLCGAPHLAEFPHRRTHLCSIGPHYCGVDVLTKAAIETHVIYDNLDKRAQLPLSYSLVGRRSPAVRKCITLGRHGSSTSSVSRRRLSALSDPRSKGRRLASGEERCMVKGHQSRAREEAVDGQGRRLGSRRIRQGRRSASRRSRLQVHRSLTVAALLNGLNPVQSPVKLLHGGCHDHDRRHHRL